MSPGRNSNNHSLSSNFIEERNFSNWISNAFPDVLGDPSKSWMLQTVLPCTEFHPLTRVDGVNLENSISNLTVEDNTGEKRELRGPTLAGIALILLAIVTAAGNSLVIHAIRTEKRLQTVRIKSLKNDVQNKLFYTNILVEELQFACAR